jgi:hypothetical protein
VKKEAPAKAKPAPAAKPLLPAPKPVPQAQPVRVKELIIEKKVVKKSGPSILDALLGGLLKLLQFILKAAGMLFDAFITKPGKALFRYLTKKPVRILYLLLVLLVLYAIIVNWPLISLLLEKLKLS